MSSLLKILFLRNYLCNLNILMFYNLIKIGNNIDIVRYRE